MIGGGIPWEWVVIGFAAGFAFCAAATVLLNRPSRPGRLQLPRERRKPGGEA